ncbi:MAG TPA: ABC transporter permease [Bryobacteraceae bacterium]|nr:ABC transporter permease [Bryobacteraceae bacterium]
MLKGLFYRIRAVSQRDALDAEVEGELQAHLEREAEKYERTGVPHDEALRRARVALGGTMQVREACRDADGVRWLEDFVQDCRYTLRGTRRSKGFFALLLSVLALGIGVNAAIFNVVDAKLIRPLPFRHPSELIVVWDTYMPQFPKLGISPPELQAWQAQTDVFQETAWYCYVPLDGNMSAPGLESIAVHASFVSANLFRLLGVSPLTGRSFSTGEDPSSVLISERLWRSQFSSSPGVIGKTIRFGDRELTVVGVMPGATQFPEWADFWLPKGPLLGDQLVNPVQHALGFIGRLKPGVKQDQATSRLLGLSRELAKEHPKTSTGWGMRVSSLHDDLTESIRPALLLLLCAASFLLLTGCANIASLLFSRSSARSKEIAVRIAIGAVGSRILRQLLTESLVLAVFGALGGVILAGVMLKIVLPAQSHMGPAILLFLLMASLVTGILVGIAPAVQCIRSDTQSVIKSATTTGSGAKLRSGLVAFEIALTMMLVIGAAILAKSFVRLMHTDPGFNPQGVLTMRILAPSSEDSGTLFHLLQQRLVSFPSVQQLAITNTLPLIADRAAGSRFNVPGSPLINPDALPAAQVRIASPDYFHALQIALTAGRPFNERDLNQPVVIINETMAKRFWPGRSVVGLKFITGPWGPKPTWSTIIGVVANVKQFGLDSEPSFDIYYPSLQGQYLIIKTSGHPSTLEGVAQEAIRSIDPQLAISDIRSMEEIASTSTLSWRWTMYILAAFAGFALCYWRSSESSS